MKVTVICLSAEVQLSLWCLDSSQIEGTAQPRRAYREREQFIQKPKLSGKRIQRVALAAAALILSGFALLFICKRFSSNLTEAGLTHRRLAGSDGQESTSDEELDEILNQCLEFEAEHGEPPPDPDWEEPAAKKARLVAFLKEAAASHESAGLDPTVAAGWSHILPSGTQAAPSSGLQSTDEALTHEVVSLPGFDINPDLNPDAFLEQIPPLEEESKEEGTVPGEPSVLPENEDQEQPSTSCVLAGQPSSTRSSSLQQSALERHPFYRLPDIEPSAIRRRFRLVQIYSRKFHGATFFKMVLRMRELYLLPTLGTEEVEELMCAAESLVWYLRNHPSKGAESVTSSSQAVRYLGQYFMMLDCLLSARQLFGPEMISDESWQALTETIDTDLSFPEPFTFAGQRKYHNYALVSRLVPAMELMKAGVRPSAEDVVFIKRMLLCSKHLDIHFRQPRWDPWRQDDAQFTQTHEDSSDDSEDHRK
ncbi:hypothetical protein Emed_002400 [Eimeria media]